MLASAQTVRTDTVKQGYYIPFDSNYVSCKVAITAKGKNVEFTNTTGNHLPDSLVQKIGKLEAGSVVAYTEVTILKKGILEKSNTVRYVVGHRNSVYALRDPTLPDTIPAGEIAAIVLDPHVYFFQLSYILEGAYFVYDHTGNGVAGYVQERIRALPSGTKVYFENIKRKEDDGTLRIAPPQIYIVK